MSELVCDLIVSFDPIVRCEHSEPPTEQGLEAMVAHVKEHGGERLTPDFMNRARDTIRKARPSRSKDA